ncbi:unnamed protein product, partial [Discosporangium mesarthrocarpum]
MFEQLQPVTGATTSHVSSTWTPGMTTGMTAGMGLGTAMNAGGVTTSGGWTMAASMSMSNPQVVSTMSTTSSPWVQNTLLPAAANTMDTTNALGQPAPLVSRVSQAHPGGDMYPLPQPPSQVANNRQQGPGIQQGKEVLGVNPTPKSMLRQLPQGMLSPQTRGQNLPFGVQSGVHSGPGQQPLQWQPPTLSLQTQGGVVPHGQQTLNRIGTFNLGTLQGLQDNPNQGSFVSLSSPGSDPFASLQQQTPMQGG